MGDVTAFVGFSLAVMRPLLLISDVKEGLSGVLSGRIVWVYEGFLFVNLVQRLLNVPEIVVWNRVEDLGLETCAHSIVIGPSHIFYLIVILTILEYR